MTVLLLVALLLLATMTVVSTFDASGVETSSSSAIRVGSAFNTLTTFAGFTIVAVIIGGTVDTHVLVTAHLSVATVSTVLTTQTDILIANTAVVTIIIVGAFDTLVLVTNTIAIVIGVAIVGGNLVAAWTSSD